MPKRDTYKGHGKPATFTYYGMAPRPSAEGVKVTVENLGRRGYQFRTAEGEPVEGRLWFFAPATQFWANATAN